MILSCHLGGRVRKAESLRPTAPLVLVKRWGKGRRGRRSARLRKSPVRKLCKTVEGPLVRGPTPESTMLAASPQAMSNKCLLFEQPYLWCSVMEPTLIETELVVEEMVKVIRMRGKRDGYS